MPKPPKLKRLKNQWAAERELEIAKALDAAHKKGVAADVKPPPERGTPEEAVANLPKAMALPVVQSEVMKYLHLDLVGKSIEEDLQPGVDNALRIDARGTVVALVNNLIRAQQKMGGGNTVNVQINTGDVKMPSVKVDQSQDQEHPE